MNTLVDGRRRRRESDRSFRPLVDVLRRLAGLEARLDDPCKFYGVEVGPKPRKPSRAPEPKGAPEPDPGAALPCPPPRPAEEADESFGGYLLTEEQAASILSAARRSRRGVSLDSTLRRTASA
jgi:hypothetical protein